MRQVLTIGPDGTLSGLQRKPGQGLDLRQFGPCEIKRASEIVPTDDGQRWMVQLLTGPYAGQFLTAALWWDAGCRGRPAGADACPTVSEPIRFADYDTAVQAEIAVLDGLRLRGIH